MNREFFTSEQQGFIIAHYATHGIAHCARVLQCDRKSVSKFLRLSNLRLTVAQLSAVHRRSREQLKDEDRAINPAQFRDVTTPEVAYFLGYVWADGYAKRQKNGAHILSMLIANRDYLHVAKTFDRLGRWGIRKFWPKPKGQFAAQIYAGNKPLVSYLIDKDYHVKSLVSPTKILTTIPDNLKHYFWRGYFDGDGCFRIKRGIYQFYFCGSYRQEWDAHCALLDLLNIKHRIIRKSVKQGGSSTVCCCDCEDVYAFGKYLYQGYPEDGIGLPRKYSRWTVCRDIAEARIKARDLALDEDTSTKLDRETIYRLVKKYQPYLTLKKLATHFNEIPWKISEHTQMLAAKGRIRFIGRASMTRYALTDYPT